MSLPRLAALLLGACLSVFGTYVSASLSLSLSVSSGPASLCFGSASDNFWEFTPTVSAGDTGPMFFTIYDIGVACTLEPSSPNWTSSNHLLGTTPPGVSVIDDSTINNVVFSCGSTAGTCPGFGGSAALNSIVLKFATGCFAYSWQDDNAAGAPQSGTGTICAPGPSTAPEPATLALLGLGLAGLGFSRRKQ